MAFLGVHNATEGSSSGVHTIEADLSAALAVSDEFTLKATAEIDRDIGEAERMIILSSESPARQLIENASSLGGSYALMAVVSEENDRKAMTLTLWDVSNGTRSWSETVVAPAKASDALGRMRKHIVELEEARAAHDQEVAMQQLKAAARTPAEPAPAVAAPASPATAPAPTDAGSPPAAAAPPAAPAPAVTAARITHTPPNQGPAYQAVTIDADIQCPGDCDGVVYYRVKGNAEWLSANMVPMPGSLKRVAALSPMPPGEVEYYISVSDRSLNELASEGGQAHPHLLKIVAPAPAVAAAPATSPASTQVAASPSSSVAAADQTPPEHPVDLTPPEVTATEAHPTVPPAAVKPPAGSLPLSRPGLALAASGGALLVTCVVLGALGHHEYNLVQSGTLATGGDIQHAGDLNQRYDTASLVTGLMGAVASGAGAFLMFRPVDVR